jgi:lipopolysaccharide/colanic/teichoic acid biosynthesis glycosyltransferase
VKTPQRLLFVDNSLDSFYAYRMPLAKAAMRAGFDVHVAAPPGRREATILAEGLTVHALPMTRSGMNLYQEASCVRHLYRLYRSVKPDLIHHLRLKPVLYGGIAAYAARVPAEVSMPTGLGHVFTAQTTKAQLMRKVTLWGCKIAFRHQNVRVIFQNPDDMEIFLHAKTLGKDRCALIRGSGVDISDFVVTPEPQGQPVVVLAARMLRDKGIAEFVEAARILRQRGSRARFVLVGDTDPGNPTAISAAELKAWQEHGLIEWWGFREDMRPIFAQANIVCLPSYREGVPKVLIEAAAAGRAIVATDVPGCREIVRHGQNGLLVPVKNVSALADSLSFLIDNSHLRSRMGRKGRHLAVADFSMDRVITETIEIYRNVLSRTGRQGQRRRNAPKGKRILDIAVSGLGLLLASPLLASIAIAIKVSSRGPVLYGGVRAGLNNVPFRMWKFRSMVQDAETLGGSATAKDDARITEIGHFLRRYKLDELPQLVNVLRGEMSLVGPRPEVQKYIDLLSGDERMILEVQPGITDWASIWNANEGDALEGSPDPEATYEELIRPAKIALQMKYAREQSMHSDCRILFHTLLKLLNPLWIPQELSGIKPVARYKDLAKI